MNNPEIVDTHFDTNEYVESAWVFFDVLMDAMDNGSIASATAVATIERIAIARMRTNNID